MQRELDRCHQQLAILREQHLKQTESEHGWREKREAQSQRDMEQLKKQHEDELAQLRVLNENLEATVDKEKEKNRAEFAQVNGL